MIMTEQKPKLNGNGLHIINNQVIMLKEYLRITICLFGVVISIAAFSIANIDLRILAKMLPFLPDNAPDGMNTHIYSIHLRNDLIMCLIATIILITSILGTRSAYLKRQKQNDDLQMSKNK